MLTILIFSSASTSAQDRSVHKSVKQKNETRNIQFESQAEMLESISLLYTSAYTSPMSIIKQLSLWIQSSKKQNWDVAYLSASILRLEMLVIVEDVEAVAKGLPALIGLAKVSNDQSYNTRLELIELYLAAFNDAPEIVYRKQINLLAKAANIEDPLLSGRVYRQIGETQIRYSNLRGAIDSLDKAFSKFSQAQSKEDLGHVLSSLGNINIDLNNPQGAIAYFDKAIQIATELKHGFALSILQYNISKAYFSAGEFAKAKQALHSAMIMNEELQDIIGLAFSKQALANIYMAEEDWQSAISIYQQTLEVFQDSGNTRMQFGALSGLARSYTKIGKTNDAEEMLIAVADLLAQFQDATYTSTYNKLKSEWEYAVGNYQAAYNILKQNNVLTEGLHTKEQKAELQKFRVQFDVRLKDKQNQALQIQNELNSLKISQQQKQAIIWRVVIGLVLVSLVILIWILRVQIKNRNHFRAIAFVDPLTNAPNRRNVLKYAESLLAQAVEINTSFTIGIIDFDKFKLINDNFGHNAGDNVLMAFSKACEECLRGQDRFGRYGGEEWLIVFANTEEKHIRTIFTRLRRALNSKVIEGLPDNYEITFSMGVAQFDQDDSIESLISRADSKLYQAKNAGRDQIVF